MLKRNRKRGLKNVFLKPLTWFKGLGPAQRTIAIVVLVAVGFVAYTQTANYLEKRKFDRIEATVVELTDRINHEFGTKTVEVQGYCYKASRKYEAEPTICVVSSKIANFSSGLPALSAFISHQNNLVENVEEAFAGLYFYSVNSNSDCRINTEDTSPNIYLRCSAYARSAIYPPKNTE